MEWPRTVRNRHLQFQSPPDPERASTTEYTVIGLFPISDGPGLGIPKILHFAAHGPEHRFFRRSGQNRFVVLSTTGHSKQAARKAQTCPRRSIISRTSACRLRWNPHMPTSLCWWPLLHRRRTRLLLRLLCQWSSLQLLPILEAQKILYPSMRWSSTSLRCRPKSRMRTWRL